MLFLMRRRGFANGSREPARLMHLHENPKSKTIAFREELTREHCIPRGLSRRAGHPS
jgi:hypothetical protein